MKVLDYFPRDLFVRRMVGLCLAAPGILLLVILLQVALYANRTPGTVVNMPMAIAFAVVGGVLAVVGTLAVFSER